MRLIAADAILDGRFPEVENEYQRGWNDALYGTVCALPTIEAEPVTHSEWIWDDNAIDWGLGAWVCRECHSRNENIHAHENEDPYVWLGSQFCPVCGA